MAGGGLADDATRVNWRVDSGAGSRRWSRWEGLLRTVAGTDTFKLQLDRGHGDQERVPRRVGRGASRGALRG